MGRGRSSADVLASLIRCGAFEAAIEAGHFPGFGGTDTQPLLDEARDLSTRQAEIENRLDAIDRRMRALPGIALPASNRQSIESEVYEALGEVVRRELAAAGTRVERVEAVLVGFEQEWHATDTERRRRLQELTDWLAGGGVVVDEQVSVDDAERLVQKLRHNAAARRSHLQRLEALDGPGVPEQLRASAREYLAAMDRPENWPTEEAARLADLYVELFVELSRDWWAQLRGLDIQDKTYQKIHEIAAVFVQRLPSELSALVAGDLEDAQLFVLLAEKKGQTASEFYDALLESRLLEEDPAAPPEADLAPQELPQTLVEAESRMIGVLSDRPVTSGPSWGMCKPHTMPSAPDTTWRPVMSQHRLGGGRRTRVSHRKSDLFWPFSRGRAIRARPISTSAPRSMPGSSRSNTGLRCLPALGL